MNRSRTVSRGRRPDRNRSRRRPPRPRPGTIMPPSMGSSIYTGPSRLPVTVTPPTITQELQKFSVAGISDGTNLGIAVSSNDVYALPEVTSYWANLYQEYRALSVRLEFWPNYANALNPALTNSIAANAQATWYSVVTRDDTTPSSYASLQSDSSLRIFPLNQSWFREVKMAGTAESQFTNIGSPPPVPIALKAFIGTFPGSTTITMGEFIARYIVEFRTRV